ncbi:MAG: hypothetical protein A3C85_01590 [Candidatus Doudnabacteria bacterium RIFCSPHIGHO2_02_FULL_48_21]|uniref:Uncharacterized protein n=1 Tax=Candidatus Doudnabacteria bacterium RIFCSPLOWO2_02_FULL_48_13 TaxID=1817845 RepID=A0A1F5QDN8_9BACT|nr:MAG: hypothetical protein A3K05_02555 [Candidatus Doudnabacteria bacterium RIFCSPHIGHO2_01_48_18]OGE77486.1 MAG: hypothetical protein A2668_04365 [Candidatus Doudnabacteria bacterium RIFCSPHIGHO2_01_FULL_48_180]OGE91535.1 MAG: hypothetical protein A3F44_03875 [Candidatus Doudnabacteria bacterium RIFCSPHIGHO2_12_FULL_47_25]OGE93126.1 MAG: hypothetical protein A3C85_01590 [Candidatus Doudnabacteria bacterium RIFCSPHIGHO2_02_FULL_48_21]OGE97276.1 MAG: hypothetical protein A3A83_01550 [Candidatu
MALKQETKFGRGVFAKVRKAFFSIAFFTVAIVSGLLFGMYGYYSATLPGANALVNRDIPESTKIFDREGTLLYEFHGDAKRTVIPLNQIPEVVRQATIAVEDKNFYRHVGFDPEGIARASYINWKTGTKTQGASTITQQFVRNAVLTREKTFARKFKELVLAFNLEMRYSKEKILELYFNEIPYGSNLYGIQAASQGYFAKDPKDLTVAEAAYLAALPKAPTYYSPYGPHIDELDARVQMVLQKMHEQGFISAEQLESAKQEKVAFQKLTAPIIAPHFVFYVQDFLVQRYGEKAVREGGLRVRTTLDLRLQRIAEEIITKNAAINQKNWRGSNAALVAVNPKTGEVMAMVGGKDYFDKENDGEVNVALRPRQPGSSFKPYVYATAFQRGMSPASLVMDVTTNFGRYGSRDYIPNNYSGRTYGPLSLRQALQGSLNIPAVKTLMLVGIDNAINTAEAMGLTTLADRKRYGPALVLGGAEVKLLEHTAAFGAFGASGILHETTPILEVTDRNGKVLETIDRTYGKQVIDPQIAYQISHVLSDNEARMFIFSSRKHKLMLPDERPVAVKTGTTQEFRDAWTVGYTPSLATGVWVGNNDNMPMRPGADGLYVAAPIWNEFMAKALANTPPEQFIRPPGIVEVAVDKLTGKLPTAYTPSTKTEIFAMDYNIPTEQDDFHIPAGFGENSRVATIFRSEKPGDPAWDGPVRAWAQTHGFGFTTGTYIVLDEPPPEEDKPEEDLGGANEGLAVQVRVHPKISSVPWSMAVQTSSADPVVQITVKIDDKTEIVHFGSELSYDSRNSYQDGSHLMTVEILTEQGHSDVRAIPIQFALNTETVPGPTPEPPVFAENTPPPQGEPVSSTTPQENL